MNEQSASRDQRKNAALYLSLLIGVVAGCLPYGSAQGISAILVIVALVLGYILRDKEGAGSLVAHHATFVIRTIWIWSLFLMIGMIGAAFVIYRQGDASAIDDMVNSIYGGMIPTEADIQAVSDRYIMDNYDLMVRTAIIWLAPAQVYALWRVVKGFSRAWSGYRLQSVKGWF